MRRINFTWVNRKYTARSFQIWRNDRLMATWTVSSKHSSLWSIHLQPSGPDNVTELSVKKTFNGFFYLISVKLGNRLSSVQSLDNMLSALEVRVVFCPVAIFATIEINHRLRFFGSHHLQRRMRVLPGGDLFLSQKSLLLL